MALLLVLYSKSALLSKLASLALLFTLVQFTASLPVDQPDSLLLPNMVQATRPSCAELANYPKWYQASEKFDNGDCEKAIGNFNKEYVQTHEGQRYEYYNSKFSPIHGIPTQRVPMKFGYGM